MEQVLWRAQVIIISHLLQKRMPALCPLHLCPQRPGLQLSAHSGGAGFQGPSFQASHAYERLIKMLLNFKRTKASLGATSN